MEKRRWRTSVVAAKGYVVYSERGDSLHVLQLHAAAVEASDGHCRQHGVIKTPKRAR